MGCHRRLAPSKARVDLAVDAFRRCRCRSAVSAPWQIRCRTAVHTHRQCRPHRAVDLVAERQCLLRHAQLEACRQERKLLAAELRRVDHLITRCWCWRGRWARRHRACAPWSLACPLALARHSLPFPCRAVAGECKVSVRGKHTLRTIEQCSTDRRAAVSDAAPRRALQPTVCACELSRHEGWRQRWCPCRHECRR